MMMDEKSTDTQCAQLVRPLIRQVITYSFYLLCMASVALFGLACTIGNDDENVIETPPTGISFEVLFTSGLSAGQIGNLLMEVWIHDLDDEPFDDGSRDSDQVDIASPILRRVAVRDRVPAENLLDDRMTFDIDFENNISAGNNLVFSVLLFPASESTEPTLVAREGSFTLPMALGQTISMTLGAVELVEFGDPPRS